jgi:hypothetical protein
MVLTSLKARRIAVYHRGPCISKAVSRLHVTMRLWLSPTLLRIRIWIRLSALLASRYKFVVWLVN